MLITYRDIEGQTGLYARLKRKADLKWWDEVNDTWDAAADADSNIALTESSTEGVYTGTANISPAEGGMYLIHVYNSGGTLLWAFEYTYNPDQKTALEMVQAVQKELRMPQASAISESHAQLILSFINRVNRNLIAEGTVWDAMKLRGQVSFLDGINLYTFQPVNRSKVDVIQDIRIGTDPPLERLPDPDFREFKRLNTSEEQPTYYRNYARAGGALIIEVATTPDTTYLADFTMLLKPLELSEATDVPLLDANMIVQGAIAIAKRESGLDASQDEQIFLSMLSGRTTTEGDANWEGVNAI